MATGVDLRVRADPVFWVLPCLIAAVAIAVILLIREVSPTFAIVVAAVAFVVGVAGNALITGRRELVLDDDGVELRGTFSAPRSFAWRELEEVNASYVSQWVNFNGVGGLWVSLKLRNGPPMEPWVHLPGVPLRRSRCRDVVGVVEDLGRRQIAASA